MKTTSVRFQIVPSIMDSKQFTTRAPVQQYGEIKSRFDLPNLELTQCISKCRMCEGAYNDELIKCGIVCMCSKVSHKIKKTHGWIWTQCRKTSFEPGITYPKEAPSNK